MATPDSVSQALTALIRQEHAAYLTVRQLLVERIKAVALRSDLIIVLTTVHHDLQMQLQLLQVQLAALLQDEHR